MFRTPEQLNIFQKFQDSNFLEFQNAGIGIFQAVPTVPLGQWDKNTQTSVKLKLNDIKHIIPYIILRLYTTPYD